MPTCRYCHKSFTRLKQAGNRQHCYDPDCIELNKGHYKDLRAKARDEFQARHIKAEKKKAPIEKRLCYGECGRDPFPNRFYCPKCHHDVFDYT
jgi:hypothetical protein